MRAGYWILSVIIAAGITSCGKNRDDNRYTLIARHWVESARLVNGEETDPTQLRHIFFGSGYEGRLEYEYICGLRNDDCLPGKSYRGTWQLLSDTTLSTEINGAIRVYDIEKLTPTALWLKFNSGNSEIVSKMIRYSR